MNKYIISITNQTIEVWAKDHQSAMKKAVRTETKIRKVFGSISGCLKDGDDEDDEYLFSIDYMTNNGYFEGLEYKPIN